MKTRFLKFANFCCMVIVLGIQALLQGSWSVPDTVPADPMNDSLE